MAVKGIFPVIMGRKIMSLVDLLDNFYLQNETERENWPVLNRFSALLAKTTKIIFIDFTANTTFITIVIVLLNSFRAGYFYLLPFSLPEIPVDTPIGFMINSIWHFATALYCTFAYIFFDGINVFLILHVLLMSNILCNKICIVDGMITEKKTSQLELLRRIGNLITMQNEMRS